MASKSQQKRRAYMGFQTEREQAMADRIQLKEPGSSIVLSVSKIGTETVEGSDYLLFSDGHKELLVPKSSVVGQLERVGVDTYNGLVGKGVKFSRSTKLSKYGKPFWNLDPASIADLPTNGSVGVGGNAGNSASAAPAESGASDDEDALRQRALYATRMRQAVAYVLENIEPLFKARGIGLTGDEVYKHAYSIWAEWSRKGII